MATYPTQLFIESTGKVKTTLTGAVYYTATNRITLKRGDSASFEVKFLTRGTNTPFLLTAGSKVQIAMKQSDGYGSDILYCAFGQSSADPATAADPYVVPVTLSSSALNTLFTNGEVERAFVDVMFEVSWSEDSDATWNSTTDPVVVRLYNEVVKPDLTTIWLD
jgi:hypothetical protein